MGSFISNLSPKFLFKTKAPNDLRNYVGRTVLIPEFMDIDGKKTKTGEKKVEIITICGNRFQPNYYEINGEHLIGMLRFHAQMLNAKDITEDQFLAFEEMKMEAEKQPEIPNGKKDVSHG